MEEPRRRNQLLRQQRSEGRNRQREAAASASISRRSPATREKVLAGGHQWGIGLRVRF